MTTPIRIAINGFGRIGRTILRQLLVGNQPIEIVLINDIAPLETCGYLFAYDSVFGVYPEEVTETDGGLRIGSRKVRFTHVADISTLDLSGIDVVLECTGRAKTRESAERGLKAGARNVLLSGPSTIADATVVMGANDDQMQDHHLISNASCTTNALAPIVRYLDASLGLTAAHMTTIHCYTSSQPMTDAPRESLARSRAGALSMVPTTTSATHLVTEVLPHLKDHITGAAVRVPTASVSCIDLTFTTRDATDPQTLNALIGAADRHIIGTTDKPLVSMDLRKRSESLIVATPETMSASDHQHRVFGWYDNEWGFSARMIDMTLRMAAR
ncbi:type I glyceraldehyde-3-phosphate dehydrogenase [Cognatiyoonia koreensis]|nr:glyceraldehyde 3-phosphate dehydrogenase NAD-binding domain-containing protein [Cognatiyoonia koreensis]